MVAYLYEHWINEYCAALFVAGGMTVEIEQRKDLANSYFHWVGH